MRNSPSWRSVPDTTLAFFKSALCPARLLFSRRDEFPRGRHHILWQPESHELYVGLDKSASEDSLACWRAQLDILGFPRVEMAPLDAAPRGFGTKPWVWLKRAADPVLATTAKLLNYQPSAANQLIGGPSPLAAALTSGLVGAGLGYGVGALGEQFLPPQDFEPGKLRRNAALAGAAIGASPGLLWGATAQKAHPDTPGWRAWLSGWPFRAKDADLVSQGTVGSPRKYKGQDKSAETARQAALIKKACEGVQKILQSKSYVRSLVKMGWFEDPNQPLGQGLDQLAGLPMIPRDEFGRTVWGDPNTPMPIRAATTGIVNAASWANNNSPFVSPWDIASVTATGAARGLLVGKTLGVLAGLKPESQQNLQRAGIWGGMLQAVIPNIFPDQSRLFGS